MFSIIDNILANNNQDQWELLNEASDVATYVCSNEVEEDGSVECSLMSSDRVAMYFRVLQPNLVETHRSGVNDEQENFSSKPRSLIKLKIRSCTYAHIGREPGTHRLEQASPPVITAGRFCQLLMVLWY